MNTRDFLSRIALMGLLLTALTLSAADTSLVDPPKTKNVWTVDAKLKVAAPKGFYEPEITYADYGPFAAMGTNQDATSKRLIVDLTTGKTVGSIGGKLAVAAPSALSGDGKTFAISKSFGSTPSGTIVFDTTTGRRVADIVTGSRPEKLTFVGPDKILIRTGFPKQSLTLHDAATGVELFAFPMKEPFGAKMAVVTPGGKFMAYESSDAILLFDLTTGKSARDLPIPASEGSGKPRCDGLAFSPDGTELAGYFLHATPLVIRWDLTTGKVVATHKIDKPTRAYTEMAKIEYSADGLALMVVQELVIERTSGKTLYRTPAEVLGRTYRKLASATEVVDVTGVTGKNRGMVVLSQDKDKIAKLLKSFGEGLGAVDALLPPTKSISLGKVEPVDVPLSAGAWQHKTVAGPDLAQLARRGIPLTVRGNEIDSIHISGGKKPSAVFEIATRNGLNQVDDSAVRTIVRTDLSTGKEVCRIELPPGLKLSSISADGDRASTIEMGQTAKRVDIWDLTAGGRHIVGMRPGEKETDAKRGRPIFAGFSPSGKLVTVTDDATAISWTLPDLTANWMLSMNEFSAPTIDPSGTLIAGFARDGIRLFDIETGTNVGDLLPSFDRVSSDLSPQTVAFRADGAEAASILQKGPGQNFLVTWDLGTGKVASEFALSPTYGARTRVKYAESGFVLIDERDLIDPKLKETVWSYNLNPFDGRAAIRTPDNRLWYAASPSRDQPAVLLASASPDAETLARIRAVSTGPGSLIKPGARVSIDLKYTGSFAASGKTRTLETLKQIYTKRGLTVVDSGGDIQIDIRAVEKPTKETISYRSMGAPSGGKLTGTEVPVIEIEVSTSASMGGSTIWEVKSQTMDLRRNSSPFVRLPQGVTDLTKHLHETFWQTAPANVALNALPRFLAKTPDGMVSLPGTSTLSATGVKSIGDK